MQSSSKLKTRLWTKIISFSILVFLAGSIYLFLRRGEYNLYIANKALAVTALVLVCLSLALSAICYFWDFADRQIIYRKHLGIIGFFYALAHTIVSLFFLPAYFTFPTYFLQPWQPFLAGLLALVILTFMAATSNNWAIKKLGAENWRKLMRITGYTALILAIIHLTLLKYRSWVNWLTEKNKILPPLSLLAILFATGILLLRLAFWVSRNKKNHISILLFYMAIVFL